MIRPILARLRTACVTSLISAVGCLATTTAAVAASTCDGPVVACETSGGVAAGVTRFRAGNEGAAHWAQASITYRNQGKTAVTLAYVDRSGQLIDEHGNRYAVKSGSVRGIGVAARRAVDTSFTLQPGESGEARFEFTWSRRDPARTGLRFEMAMAVREVSLLSGGQVKLGREHALRWTGLSDGVQAAPSAGTAAQPGGPAASPTPAADACAGRAACRDLGLFVAEATRLVKSPRQQNLNKVRVEFQVRNNGSQPLTLGYLRDSGLLIDDRGERYTVDWRDNANVSGIGQVEHRQADTRFRLSPGQTGRFALDFSRYGTDSGGRVFSADLVLAQLEVLPGDQVRTVREHAMGFQGLGVGASRQGGQGAADLVQAVQQLTDLFKKK
jgi:hypothetical protein